MMNVLLHIHLIFNKSIKKHIKQLYVSYVYGISPDTIKRKTTYGVKQDIHTKSYMPYLGNKRESYV